VWGGEVKAMPDPARASDAEWTEYLFLEPNVAGEIYEWWLHAPTNFWFIARRNTLTDTILETMTVDDFFARASGSSA
jgi:sarcosine oxidase, subunit delta